MHKRIIRKKIIIFTRSKTKKKSDKFFDCESIEFFLIRFFSDIGLVELENDIKNLYVINHHEDLKGFSIYRNDNAINKIAKRKPFLFYTQRGINLWEFETNIFKTYIYFLNNPIEFMNHRDKLISKSNRHLFFKEFLDTHYQLNDTKNKIDILSDLRNLSVNKILPNNSYKKYRTLIINSL